MQAHRYDEAIALFEARLRENPTDLGALLRMGLCHLLNRSEPAFLTIHERATAIIRELGSVPRQTERLWSHYEHLFKLVTATALVVGGMADLVACNHPVSSAHKYSGGVYHDPGAPVGGAASQPTEAYAPGEDPGSGDSGATAQPKPAPPSGVDPQTTSAHRYSGGVYLKPKPAPPSDVDPQATSAHKYSGGVYLKPQPAKP
jgi:hypothetical protein